MYTEYVNDLKTLEKDFKTLEKFNDYNDDVCYIIKPYVTNTQNAHISLFNNINISCCNIFINLKY